MPFTCLCSRFLFLYMIRVPKTCCSLLVYVYNREPFGCHISYKSILIRKVPSIVCKTFKWFISFNSFSKGFVRSVLNIRIRWIRYDTFWLPGSVFTVLDPTVKISTKLQKKFPFTAQI